MASDVSIVNQALRRLGGTRITSLTDGSKNANAANDIYEDLRDELLRAHPWNFATTRVELARLAAAPAFGYGYNYSLPTDWLKTVSVHDNDAGAGALDFKEETEDTAKVLRTDAEHVYLRYVRRIIDANMMTPDFRSALAYALARDLAIPIASSGALFDRMEIKASQILAFAKSSDARDSTPETRPRGSWVDSRGGWRR
jgi:hypothetical protein